MRILVALAIALAIGVGGVSVYVDRILKGAVERGATAALGVETTIGSVGLGLLAGELRLSDLEVANPEGFEGPYIMKLRSGHVSVSIFSLLSDTIEVGDVTLDGLEVALEQRGRRTNYGVLIANLGASESETASSGSAESAGPNVLIREILIRDTTAKVALLSGTKTGKTYSVEVPEIRLTDIGTADERGVPLATVVGAVTKAVLTSVAKSGGGLPDALTQQLRAGLRELGPVGSRSADVEKAIESGAKKLLDGARGLFGGND